MSTPKDLMQNAVENDAIEFSSNYKKIMDERLIEAIEELRISVAKNIYGEEQDLEENFDEEDLEDEDLDFDEEDLEDEDLDFDDLDLEDLEDEDD